MMIPTRNLSRLFSLGALALLYFGAGKLGLHLAFVNASASAVWPPTGLAIGGLLILGLRAWPAVFLGAFLVNVTTAGTVPSSLGIAVGNTLEGVCGAWLVSRFAHGRHAFDRVPDVLKFALLAGSPRRRSARRSAPRSWDSRASPPGRISARSGGPGGLAMPPARCSSHRCSSPGRRTRGSSGTDAAWAKRARRWQRC